MTRNSIPWSVFVRSRPGVSAGTAMASVGKSHSVSKAWPLCLIKLCTNRELIVKLYYYQ